MRIAVIPARGGSKRLPKKNIMEFCGKPMIAHVLEAILETNLFDEVHVSTDDEEVAKISKSYGAAVPFLRDPSLATDHAPVLSVLKWVIKQYEAQGRDFKTIMMVMPCSPLLLSEDFSSACQQFEASDKAAPLLSVAKYPSPIEWAFQEKNGLLVAANPEKLLIRSQDLKPTYYDAGLFSIFDKKHLNANESVASTFLKYELPLWKAVDIDEEQDLEVARKMMILKDGP